MCNWRKEHNRIKGYDGIPNNKNLQQPNVQLQKEIVKDVEVKQQKKIIVLTQEEVQKFMDLLTAHREEMKEIMDKGLRRMSETLDSGLKKPSETLDRDSKSVKEPVDQKVEDSKKEMEITEDKDCLLYTSRCV